METEAHEKNWALYGDGSCGREFGGSKFVPASWAYVAVSQQGDFVEKTGSALNRHVNRMELSAIVRGLSFISSTTRKKVSRVHIFSDSRYVFRSMLAAAGLDKKDEFIHLANVPPSFIQHVCDPKSDSMSTDPDLQSNLFHLMRVMHIPSFSHVRKADEVPLHARCHDLANETRRKIVERLSPVKANTMKNSDIVLPISKKRFFISTHDPSWFSTNPQSSFVAEKKTAEEKRNPFAGE